MEMPQKSEALSGAFLSSVQIADGLQSERFFCLGTSLKAGFFRGRLLASMPFRRLLGCFFSSGCKNPSDATMPDSGP
jgi:hypothetical protein